MATAIELRNETSEALQAVKKIRDDGGEQAAAEAAWAVWDAKKDEWQQAQKIEDAEKLLTLPENERQRPSDLRNAEDADHIGDVSREQANADPSKYIKIGDSIVPYADKDTEGYVAKYPVAVQHPSILARYRPGSELWTAKNLQEKAFATYLRKGANAADFRDNAELARALNALEEGVDSEGGYLVPTDQRTELLHDPGVPGGITRPLARVLTTTRDAGTFPSGTGVTWAAIAEEGAVSASDPVFSQVAFTIFKAGFSTTLSSELLADSASDIVSYLSQVATEARGRYEDQQAIEGDGTTEPQGLRVASVSDFVFANATSVIAADIINAYFTLPAQYRAGAVWHLTSLFMAKVIAIGATAAGIHFQLDFNGPVPRLMGKPVEMFDGTGWDNATAIATDEELGAIGDFSKYFVIDRMGMTVARSDHSSFTTDQVVFRVLARQDGRVAIPNAFRILKAA